MYVCHCKCHVMTTYREFFDIIRTIPRPSHYEDKIADFLCRFADEHHLAYRRDAHNNVVIEKPASPGYEDHEPVVLLNHMDMVCVSAPDKQFNPLSDAIDAIVYDEIDEKTGATHSWMKANGTSLGADNGIGLSMALAILADDSLPHPPIEVLTTTNEEDGMSGASHLSPTFIRGRKVINLDSEAYDETTVASAGAIIQEAHLPISRVAMPKDYITYTISVSGGKGGHSGVDINKGRANAIKVLANLLLVAIRQCDIKLYIVSFQGGQAAASIPSEAEAKVVIPKDNSSDFLSLVAQCNYALIKQFGETDPDIIIHAEPSVWHSSVMSEETTQVLLASINAVPVGVLQMSPDDITPLTSNNIGLVNITGTGRTLNLTFHTRSFIDSEMRRIASEIEKIYHLSGATVTKVMESPAWTESDTTLLQLTNSVFHDVLGFEPRAVSMHFVLEASYLVNIFPGLHIVSIGPRILEPHSIHERVDLNTCDDIWRVTLELLKRL